MVQKDKMHWMNLKRGQIMPLVMEKWFAYVPLRLFRPHQRALRLLNDTPTI